MRKVYKNTLKERKMEIREESWEKLIQSAETRDAVLFWKTIDHPFFKENTAVKIDTVVPPEDYILNFESIFNPDAVKVTKCNNGNYILEEPVKSSPITPEEIKSALQKSANGKVAGPDGVPIDVFKSNTDFWIPILLNVFNATLGGCCLHPGLKMLLYQFLRKGTEGRLIATIPYPFLSLPPN